MIVLKQCASLMQFFVRSLDKNGLAGKIWQYFTVVPEFRSTGIKNGSVLSSGAVLYVQYVQLTL